MKTISLSVVGYWGRKPLFMAKVGTGPSTSVMVKRIRKFREGQVIQFCERQSVNGMCVGCTPPWKGGIIQTISGDRLFINRW